MKALFLDIDGVLNIISPSYNTHTIAFMRFSESEYKPMMEFHLVKRLEYIIEQGEIDIIYITSSWGVTEAIREFTRLNFKYIDKIHPVSLHNGLINRAKVIQEFIETIDFKGSYVILEDEPVGWEKYPKVWKYTVQTDFREGLTNRDCLSAIGMIKDRLNYKDKNDC